MVYRIRYSDAQSRRQDEVLVEAHNTTEALVKFCHTCGAAAPGLAAWRVSIVAESEDELLAATDDSAR